MKTTTGTPIPRLLALLMLLTSISAFAYDFQVDGLCYNIISNRKGLKIVEVTYLDYVNGNPNYVNGVVEIPSEVTYDDNTYNVVRIGSNAFNNCSALTSITIPNSVTTIEKEAFINCDQITSVTIPNSVTSIGRYSFLGCTSLTSVIIPNSVTTIEEYAFSRSGLTSVTIPNSVTTIERSTFERCSSLASVTIPNSVTTIGRCAFEDCNALTSITIANSVTNIEAYAFRGSGLTSVTIPNSVTTIEPQVFYYCDHLETIEVQCEIPPFCHDAFSEHHYTNATLYIPRGTIDAYKAHLSWQDFANIVEKDFSGIGTIGAEEESVVRVSVENGTVTVTGLEPMQPITVCDIQGRTVYTGSEHRIGDLASGMYILRAGDKALKFTI